MSLSRFVSKGSRIFKVGTAEGKSYGTILRIDRRRTEKYRIRWDNGGLSWENHHWLHVVPMDGNEVMKGLI